MFSSRELEIADSSVVEKVQYDVANKKLRIKFLTSEDWYEYSNITAEMYAKLISEDSIGKTYHSLGIRDLPYKRVAVV